MWHTRIMGVRVSRRGNTAPEPTRKGDIVRKERHRVKTRFGWVTVMFSSVECAHVCTVDTRLRVHGKPYYVSVHLWSNAVPRWGEKPSMPGIVNREGVSWSRRTPSQVRELVLDACVDAVLAVLRKDPKAPAEAEAVGLRNELIRLQTERVAAIMALQEIDAKTADVQQRLFALGHPTRADGEAFTVPILC